MFFNVYNGGWFVGKVQFVNWVYRFSIDDIQ